MNGDYLLVQLLHETRLRDASSRRQQSEHHRPARAANRRRRREMRGADDEGRTGGRWWRPAVRAPARVLAWVSVQLPRR